jgi:hypothetical protein
MEQAKKTETLEPKGIELDQYGLKYILGNGHIILGL